MLIWIQVFFLRLNLAYVFTEIKILPSPLLQVLIINLIRSVKALPPPELLKVLELHYTVNKMLI